MSRLAALLLLTVLTLACLWLLWQTVPPFLNWAIFDATWDDDAQRWLAVPAYRGELDAEAGADGVARVLSDTQGHVPPALKLSERVFHEFIELFEWRPTLRFARR